MQAGAMAKKGDLFVLDMGKPVKIIDLAKNMIRLSGFEPYKDIDIVEIGLRPGEKLYEELLIKPDKLKKTDNNMIFVERDVPLTREAVDEKLDKLRAVLELAKHKTAAPEISEVMKEVVPTYFAPEDVNKNAEESKEMKLADKVQKK
jgi:FlaA1/EpsC-like NDP-sugar epimerase